MSGAAQPWAGSLVGGFLFDLSLVRIEALAARQHGIMSRALAPGALQISPPLVIEQDQLEELATGLKAALDDVEAAR